MTTQKVKRRDRDHKGVKVVKSKTHGYVLRWKDPHDRDGRRWCQESLADCTHREVAVDRAIEKAAELRAIAADIARNGPTSGRKTLEESIKEHLGEYSNPLTVGQKRHALGGLLEWAKGQGLRLVTDLTWEELANYRGYVVRTRKDTHKASTINKGFLWLTAYVNWTVNQRQSLLTGEAVRRGLRRVPERKRDIVYLRPVGLRRLLGACLRHDAAENVKVAPLVLLTMLTGMRAAEVRGLRWDEVLFDEERIDLPSARVKTGEPRGIDLSVSPAALRVLAALKLRAGSGPLVFPELAGKDRCEHALGRLIVRYGAPKFSLHVLRRSCGTILTNAPNIFGGASVWQSAARLGHDVDVARKHYLGKESKLPRDARTFESATGIEKLAGLIVAAAGGVVGSESAAVAIAV